MSFLMRSKDELQLQNIGQFSKSIQTLQFFLRNVCLEVSPFKRFQSYQQCAKVLRKLLPQYKFKLLKIWKQFIDRLNKAGLGVTVIHTYFLQCAISQQFYKLALDVVLVSVLPITITITEYLNYLILSANVYLQYERYFEAFECLNLGTTLDCTTFNHSFFNLKYLVMTSRIIGSKFDRAQFNREFDRIKVLCSHELREYEKQKPQMLKRIAYQFQLFQNISDNNKLSQKQIQYLKQTDFIDLYNKFNNNKSYELRSYIYKQLKDSTTYRIRCTEVKNKPINDFQTVRDINKLETVYKYDSKNKTMYFNNTIGTAQDLDTKINKICEIQKTLKTKPVDARSQKRQEQQLGEMRGLGGRHGFGGLSQMLGMFRQR